MKKKYRLYIDSINKSISKKLFLITTVVFILFLSFTLIVQRIFFESMYFNKKSSNIQVNTLKFIDEYNKLHDYNEVTTLIKQYEEKNGMYVAVVENRPELPIAINIEVGEGGNKRRRYIIDIINEMEKDANVMNRLLTGKLVIFKVEGSYNDNKDLVCAKIDNSSIIISTASLLPISEGISVIEEFYKFFYAVAIFIIILLSYVYSNMITNPLRKVSEKAKKMSTLDFSEKCQVESQDEIGDLAVTLNFLSENLNSALTCLQSANIQLQRDIEKERKLDQIRKEFVAAASHELKTPITIIQGYTEGLKDGVFTMEESAESLDIIIQETNRMSNLVKDMLELSALESESVDLNLSVFNLVELIHNMVRILSNKIQDKHIEVYENYYSIATIEADKFRMEQVITNFLTNALRYTEENGTIFITTGEENGIIRVSFENTCNKLSDEELERVWKKFYKVDKSRTRKLGGSGLGLSIVKNILELHGFQYGVRNTEVGVEFFFYCNVKQ